MLWLRKNALAVASIVPFGAAIYLAIIDRTASATLIAGLFVVSVVLHYFPELEVLKAFSIEAHLKKRINEAEQLLEQIQNSALVSAQNTYLYLSWGQRLGSPSFKMKGDLIAETSKLLRSLHIPEEQVTSLERPFFQFMAFDLASRFQMLLLDRVVVYEMKALAEATKQYPLHLEESDRKQAELKAVFNDAREKLKGGRSKPDDKELLQLEFHLKRLIPTDLFPQKIRDAWWVWPKLWANIIRKRSRTAYRLKAQYPLWTILAGMRGVSSFTRRRSENGAF